MGNEDSKEQPSTEGNTKTATQSPPPLSSSSSSSLSSSSSSSSPSLSATSQLPQVVTKQFAEAKEKEALEHIQKIFPDDDSNDLLRFLRARDLNVRDATEMYKNFLKWREVYKPFECDDAIFREQLGRGKCYILSVEAMGGSPLLYFLPRAHDPDVDNYKHVVRFGCYVYELAVRNLPNPSTLEFITFVNCNGVGMKNVDRKLIKTGINFYQDYFPERLHSCYVYGLPPALTTIWSFIEKLLDERTRGKIFLLKKSHHNEVLGRFPREVLPVELGGTNDKLEEYSSRVLLEFHEKRLREIQEMSQQQEQQQEQQQQEEEKQGVTTTTDIKTTNNISPSKEVLTDVN